MLTFTPRATRVTLAAALALLVWGCNDSNQSRQGAAPSAQDTTDQVQVDGMTLRDYENRFPSDQPKLATLMTWGSRAEGTETDVSTNLLRKNYYIVFDGSGSMGESDCTERTSKMTVAKTAVTEFVNLIPAGDNVGVLVFDYHGVRELVPLATDNRETIAAEISGIQPGGRTPLGHALFQASYSLEQQASRQLGYGEYNIVVVTDGAATDEADLSRIVSLVVDKTPVTIHTIGFCIGEGHILNQDGRILYKSAMNAEQLNAGLESVLAETESFDVGSFN